MGMDVYGKNPVSETGEYFRRNVWGWHPLWSYVEDVYPEIASEVEYAHTNDGDGLDEAMCEILAVKLEEDIKSGYAQEYIDKRNAHLDSLPLLDCEYCRGSGIRKDKVGIELGMLERKTCNGCNGEGKKKQFDTWYHLELNDIKEFAAFLKDCGGFQIF